jgi:hypothetical protein
MCRLNRYFNPHDSLTTLRQPASISSAQHKKHQDIKHTSTWHLSANMHPFNVLLGLAPLLAATVAATAVPDHSKDEPYPSFPSQT